MICEPVPMKIIYYYTQPGLLVKKFKKVIELGITEMMSKQSADRDVINFLTEFIDGSGSTGGRSREWIEIMLYSTEYSVYGDRNLVGDGNPSWRRSLG